MERTTHTSASSGVDGIEHVEIYVSNCHQAAYYYRTALGFAVLGQLQYRGDRPDRRSIAMQQGDIRLLLTAPLTPASDVAQHIHVHGEGIKDIAFSVHGIEAVFDRAVAGGARALQQPVRRHVGHGTVGRARIEACQGALVHSFVERPSDIDWLAGDLSPHDPRSVSAGTGLVAIDHLAMAVEGGQLDRTVAFYIETLDFRETHQEHVTTEYSAMRSKVVQNASATVRFPIMEPAAGRRRSQIDHYIDAHHGPGVQHLALRSQDIVASMSRLANVIECLPIPSTYYDSLEARVGGLAEELQALRRYGILVDRDATGLLLQLFTRPIGPRPTLFLEVIERRGAQGFGGGNIKALFEAVERAEGAAAPAAS